MLSLGGNKLSALPPELNQLRLLEELELFGNELTTIDLDRIELPSKAGLVR